MWCPDSLTATVSGVTGGNFEKVDFSEATATAQITDTIDTTTVSLAATDVNEDAASVSFKATLSNAAETEVTIVTNLGNIVIAAGQTEGTLVIDTKDSDVYLDADSLTATVSGVTGGNFEKVDFSEATATAQITDTIDTTTVSLSGDAIVNEGASAAYTVALTSAAQTDVTVNFSYSGTAADGTDFTGVALAGVPTKGSVVYNNDGTFTYTPTAGQVGADSFSYTITDADGDQSTATVNITLGTDSVPTVDVVFVQGDDGIVNESGLVGGSAAGTGLTSSGTFPIDTGNDTLASLVVGGVDSRSAS